LKKILLAAAIALCCAPCFAAIAGAQPEFAFADAPMGIRPAALAGAYTGVAGIESLNWNPGALGMVSKSAVTLAYYTWTLGTSMQYLTGIMPVGPGVLSCNFFYSNMGSIEGRDGLGQKTGKSLGAYGTGGSIGFGACPIKDLSAGGSMRLVTQSMDGLVKGGLVFDAGGLYKFNGNLSAGLAWRGLSFSGGALESSYINAGVSYNTVLGAQDRLLLDCDAKYSATFGFSAATGAEYTFSNIAAVRAGYEAKPENAAAGGISGLSFGLGLSLGQVMVDYAAVFYGDLGLSHMVSLSLQYEGGAADKTVYERLVAALADQYLSEAQESKEDGDYERSVRKLESLKSIAPDYSGIDDKIAEARKLMEARGESSKIEGLFNMGMDYYLQGKYQDAVIKWEQVQKLKPAFPGIASWLAFAKKVSDRNEKAGAEEKCFREGMALYNKCLYSEALDKWKACAPGDKADNRLSYLREKCNEMLDKMKTKEGEAEKYFNKGELVEGVKKVRVILTLCPNSEFASGKLEDLKDYIGQQVKYLYGEGIKKYTNEKIDEAIAAWEKVIELDPNGNTAASARENIEKAKTKLKTMKTLK
jgi:tetratricopeptide (TPR) repeat protein